MSSPPKFMSVIHSTTPDLRAQFFFAEARVIARARFRSLEIVETV